MKNSFKFLKIKIRELKTSPKGFTLVELLVVLALFTTVMTIASGALFSAQESNTKLQQTQVILDGVNLAMEEMIRDIRYGSMYFCTGTVPETIPAAQSCAYPNGNTVLIFKPSTALTINNSSNDRVAYYISNGVIYKKYYPEGIVSSAVQVTTSDVSVEQLSFYVKGAENTGATPPDYAQPVITLSISGVTKPSNPKVLPVRFSVQTSASSRKLDN
jgi:prepilin-type N-terminal cleavage/methylation domain-containing protein